MENIADRPAAFNRSTVDDIAPSNDPREMRYQLAIRLADNMRLGEALRILEVLGEYRDRPALLEEVRTLKSHSDAAEARLKEERRHKEQERARKEARERTGRLVVWAVVAVIAVVFMLASK